MTNKIFSINNTKIANCIRRESNLSETRNLVRVSSRTNKKTVSQFVITQDLSYWEMIIADAIYSIQLQGDKEFTPRKILTMITGDDCIDLQKDRKELLEKTIDKFCHLEIDIYCPEESNSKINERYEGTFLSVKAKKNGNGYQFTKSHAMPLYAYGEAKTQMITVSRELLNVPFKTKRNDNIILTHYLIHELELVRNQKNNVSQKIFRVLNYKNPQIFSALGINPDSFSTESEKRKKAKEIYNKMKFILNYWCSECPIQYLTTAGIQSDEEFTITITPDMFTSNSQKRG